MTLLRILRDLWRRARLHLWAARLRLQLARRGARLVLRAAPGARFDGPPVLSVIRAGDGDATLTLRLGPHSSLGRWMTLEVWAGGTNVLEMGEGAYFLNAARVQLRSGAIRLGRGVQIRDFVNVKSEGELVMGDHSILGHGTTVHAAERVVLEDCVGLAEHVTLIDSDHVADGSDTHFMLRPIRTAPVRLERNVFVGAGAAVLKGTHVGRNSVVAAGAVLTGADYPCRSLIAGAPARAIRELGPPSAD